jgi:hypothetical protein
MRSAGLGPLSYRLRTELGAEAWHWNPRGRWSDPRHRRGYWTSSSQPGPYFGASYGYRLPRRGNTIDQANNDGYSRLDDGRGHTYWKSNPYLDRHFTGEPDALHPQWVMVDLGIPRPVDAARLDWADPYATRFAVQYWTGAGPPARNGAERENAVFSAVGGQGDWRDFPSEPHAGHAGRQRVVLASHPVDVRYVRVLMSGSHRGPSGARDIRDRLGYALREVHFGRLVGGRLEDFVRHGPSNSRQSVIWVSSTDPWHRASDIDYATAQPSFERVFASGLAHGRPVMVPAAIAYGTPPDAAAELRYLRRRRYPVSQVELGEEPDGQLIGPEHYGALYVQFARALRNVDRRVKLGGPSFATAIPDWTVPPDGKGSRSWTGRFVSYLRAHRALGELGFFTFEWYPFDDVCRASDSQLAQAPGLLAAQIARQRRAGLGAGMPLYITEYGYSPFAAQTEVELAGALLDADIAGSFMALGGKTAYLYGYEPDALMRESRFCTTFGNLTLFVSDDQHRIQQPTAVFWASRLLGTEWLQPGNGPATMYATSSDLRDSAGRPIVTAYAVRRADGRLAVMLINKDPKHAHVVQIELRRRRVRSGLRGPLDIYTLSSHQYTWHARGANGRAAPDQAAAHVVAGAGARAVEIRLPPYSLSVARTRAAVPM